MRRFLAARLPAALATAIAITGCMLGSPASTGPGKEGRLTYQAKVKKVTTLTRSLSLENNDGLKRASESIQRLVEALSGIARSSATSVPTSEVAVARYQLRRAAGEFADAGSQATFELAGIEKMGEATIVYDDVTKEVTGVITPTAEVAFKFVNNGRRRSWQAEILKSPDGTTGTIFVEVEGGWTAQPTPQVYTPAPWTPRPVYPKVTPRPYPSYPSYPVFSPRPPIGQTSTPPLAFSPIPSTSPTGTMVTSSPQPSEQPVPSASPVPASPTPTAEAGGFGLQQAAAMPGYDPNGETYPPYGEDGGYDPNDVPEPAWTPAPPPPFKVFGGEYPNVVESVSIKLDLVPRGDQSLAFQMDGTFDEPETLPGTSFQVPTHWVFKLAVPKVKFDWDSNANLAQGKSSFKVKGNLSVDGPDGDDRFTFGGSFDEASKDTTLYLTNLDAKIKLLAEGKIGQPKPDRAVLVSTDDNKELGVVEAVASTPGLLEITLHEDKKKIAWQLVPKDFNPFGFMMPAPMAPPMPNVPMPVGRPRTTGTAVAVPPTTGRP